jgi:hypothetical protein
MRGFIGARLFFSIAKKQGCDPSITCVSLDGTVFYSCFERHFEGTPVKRHKNATNTSTVSVSIISA